MTIKAIETKYNGYRFRSRTEARWAVLFDALGVKYEYEPEGFELPGGGRYLPDFFIYMSDDFKRFTKMGYWIEIKGDVPTQSEIASFRHVVTATKHHGILIVGQPGRARAMSIGNTGRIGELGDFDESFSQISCCVPDPFVAAINAAKSARFEFGESGNK
jgi:hypothetical protein